MKIYKTLLRVAGESRLMTCDTIEYQGKFWLVPGWLAGPTKGTERPSMLIGLPTGLPLTKPGPEYDEDFVLPTLLSKETLAGHGGAQGYTVIHAPHLSRSVD